MGTMPFGAFPVFEPRIWFRCGEIILAGFMIWHFWAESLSGQAPPPYLPQCVVVPSAAAETPAVPLCVLTADSLRIFQGRPVTVTFALFFRFYCGVEGACAVIRWGFHSDVLFFSGFPG